MRYLSTFSGIGGMDLGLDRAGHECVGQVEIDKKARAVLERHWPDVPKHDDIRTAKEWASDIGLVGRVDLVCGGAPCQDLSVAGARAGFTGERSVLVLDMVALAAHLGAGWILYENVPASKVPTGDETWQSCSINWPTAATTTSSGELSMHSTSECPSVVVASFLSQVLQPHADPRYFLSEKAASGVLRRASKRGRTLPPELEQALRAVALSTPSTPLGGGPDDNAAQAGHLISQPLSTPAATTEASAPSQVSTLSSPSTEREKERCSG